MTAAAKGVGPIEDRELPQTLTARVVQPGARPRLHGYDVQGDLARHYRFGEVVLLALTGEAPTEEAGRAFEVAMVFAGAAPISEPPAHAASLARLCGARPGSVTAVAAVALTEQARASVEQHGELLRWLAMPEGPLPESARAKTEDEHLACARMRRALGDLSRLVPVLQEDLAPEGVLLAVLFACGLQDPDRIQVALTLARLAATTAEGLATTPGALRDYPMNVPAFRYEELTDA